MAGQEVLRAPSSTETSRKQLKTTSIKTRTVSGLWKAAKDWQQQSEHWGKGILKVVQKLHAIQFALASPPPQFAGGPEEPPPLPVWGPGPRPWREQSRLSAENCVCLFDTSGPSWRNVLTPPIRNSLRVKKQWAFLNNTVKVDWQPVAAWDKRLQLRQSQKAGREIWEESFFENLSYSKAPVYTGEFIKPRTCKARTPIQKRPGKTPGFPTGWSPCSVQAGKEAKTCKQSG